MNTNAALDLISRIGELILNPIIELLFAGALIVFLWGVVEYIRGADSDQARTQGAQHILWGLVGMFIMIAAFSIVGLITNTLGINDTAAPIQGNSLR